MIMIDEKKIKQAAIECADEYYSLDFGKDREETNREIFVRGVHWAINEFLNALWHDASEERDYNRGMLLVKLKNGLFAVIRGFDNQYIEVVRWLYIDDLLPKKGGEK